MSSSAQQCPLWGGWGTLDQQIKIIEGFRKVQDAITSLESSFKPTKVKDYLESVVFSVGSDESSLGKFLDQIPSIIWSQKTSKADRDIHVKWAYSMAESSDIRDENLLSRPFSETSWILSRNKLHSGLMVSILRA